jgi:FixJ family two-component response regulator
MTTPIIHIVDDDEAVRTGLARLFRAHGYAIREYRSAGEFLLDVPGDHAGCIVLDLGMPGPSGLDLQQALARLRPTLPIVFLTGRGDVASSVRAMKAGAVDFLTKPIDPEVLVEAVRVALAGDAATRRERDARRAVAMRFATLTPRERQVFAGIVRGSLNKVVAHDLGIAERTVKMHRAQVMDKMQAASVAELVRMAALLGDDNAA